MTAVQSRVTVSRRRPPAGRLLAAVALLFLIAAPVQADAGPKPSMKFIFKYRIDQVAIVDGQMIECQDANCTDGKPLEELGPQRFTCTASECSSLAYGYSPYHKLVIRFADRTRESNVFTKSGYNASYYVTVTETALVVQERRGLRSPVPCCPSILLTIFAEVAMAALYLSLFNLPRVLFAWAPMVSLFTLPVVWLVFPQMGWSPGWVVGVSEGFAVLAEAGLLYVAARKQVPLRHVLALSLAMNLVSFSAGLLV